MSDFGLQISDLYDIPNIIFFIMISFIEIMLLTNLMSKRGFSINSSFESLTEINTSWWTVITYLRHILPQICFNCYYNSIQLPVRLIIKYRLTDKSSHDYHERRVPLNMEHEVTESLGLYRVTKFLHVNVCEKVSLSLCRHFD